MPLEIKNGDLFDNIRPAQYKEILYTEEQQKEFKLNYPPCSIVHGCNSRGVMGSGFALQIKRRYPGAFKAYREQFERDGLKLGSVNFYTDPSGVVIFNAITQDDFGRRKDRVYVNYEAVHYALKSIANTVGNKNGVIHLPFIGGGLANGNKDLLLEIFKESFENVEAVLWVN